MPNDKKKKKTEQILEAWTNLKAKLSKLISSSTNPPTELLTQITSLEAQINQIKQDNPEWDVDNTLKGQVAKLEIKKSILQQKLAYQQNWITDKLGYEQQLTIMNEKWTNSEKKLDRFKDLFTNNEIDKLKQLLKQGKI